jgi:hypothetical protein
MIRFTKDFESTESSYQLDTAPRRLAAVRVFCPLTDWLLNGKPQNSFAALRNRNQTAPKGGREHLQSFQGISSPALSGNQPPGTQAEDTRSRFI